MAQGEDEKMLQIKIKAERADRGVIGVVILN